MSCPTRGTSHLTGYPLSKATCLKIEDLNLREKHQRSFSLRNCNPCERKCIPWTFERCIEMRNFFKNRSYPYRYADFSSTFDNFGREIQLFALALDANHEEKGLIPNEDLIFYSSLGPLYSKVLKNFRQDCFLHKIHALTFKDEDLTYKYSDFNLKIKDITNIDQIFPYRFLILWEEEIDDTNWYKIPVNISLENQEIFRRKLKEILSNVPVLQLDFRFDILSELSKSKSLIDGKSKFLYERKFFGKDIEKYFSKLIDPVKRCVIPVYPSGFRDTVILTPESLSTVKLIERVVSKILSYLPHHLYGDKERDIYKRLKELVLQPGSFICRDIAKEGLTKPRLLLRICLEECAIKAPILKDFINFYDTFQIIGYDNIERGHGLGMANALTTLIQVVISCIINDNLIDTGYDVSKITYYSYNDDFVCNLPTEILDEYWDVEGRIFKDFSLIRKEEKSFHSEVGFVFCEMYFLGEDFRFTEKKLSARRTVLLSFSYDYIWEAKKFIRSLSSEYGEMVELYMEEILSYWGYEFFPKEHHYPPSCGGWLGECFLGYSIDCEILEHLDYDISVYAAYMACKSDIKIQRRRDRHKFTSIWNKLVADDPYLRESLPIGNDEILKHKLSVYNLFPKTSSEFRYLVHRRRREIYLEKRKDDISFLDFQEIILKDKKQIPPFRMIKWIEPDRYVEPFQDPYQQETPIKNYLSYKGESFCYPLSNNPEGYSILGHKIKVKMIQHWNQETFLYSKVYSQEITHLPINLDQFHHDDQLIYDLPSLLLATCKLYNNEFQYPIIEHMYDDKIKDLKLGVYSSFLTLDEQLAVYTKEVDSAKLRSLFTVSNYIISRNKSLEESIKMIDLFFTTAKETNEESLESELSESSISSSIENSSVDSDETLGEEDIKLLIPEESSIYSFIFDKETDLSNCTSSLINARDRVRELFTIYYYSNRSFISRDDYFKKVILKEEPPLVMTLLKLLAQQGFCKELVNLYGFNFDPGTDDSLEGFGSIFD